jgi:hypothetical protein
LPRATREFRRTGEITAEDWTTASGRPYRIICVLGGEMRQKTLFVILSWLSALTFLLGQTLALEPPPGRARGGLVRAKR